MSNQPPVRPWFRLASIRAIPPPSAPAAPVPRPPLTIPTTFRNINLTPSEPTPPPPSAPAPPVVAAPPPPAPAPFVLTAPPPSAPSVTAARFVADRPPPSPTTRAAQPQITSPNNIAATSRGVSPPNQNSSARTIKPEVQSLNPSQNQKTTTPPPSPQTLPPTQLRTRSEVEPRIPTEAEAEAEPKIVVVQKSIEKPMSWSTKNDEFQRELGTVHNGKQISAKEFESKEKHFHRKISDPKDSGLRVITIAGENRGAYMEIIRSSKKHKSKSLHKNGGTKTNSSGGESEGSINEAGKEAGDKDKKSWRGGTTSSSFPMTAFMNSNAQCVNNSIMFDASCKHNDPGVHLVLTKKTAGDGLRFKERVNGQYN